MIYTMLGLEPGSQGARKRTRARFLSRLARHPSAFLGLVIMLLFIVVAVFAPWVAPHSPYEGDLRLRLAPPGVVKGDVTYLLGADEQGRDMLSRIVYGARVSLLVGIMVTGCSATLGVLLGSLAGWFRGPIDQILSRSVDLLVSIPYMIFALFIMAIIGPGMINLVFALTFIGWLEFFRLTRGLVMEKAGENYVEAARAIGKRPLGIIRTEVLPNVFHDILVLAILRMGFFIVMEASLSFLGLGIQPPTPAWGSMISSGRGYITIAWWVSTLPGVATVLLVLSANLFGEGLRDLLDPRLRGPVSR